MQLSKNQKKLCIAGGTGIIVLIIFFWFYHSLDSLIASAIRSFGSEITGVSVHVSSVRLNARTGSMTIKGLTVSNPKGFKTDHALSLGKLSMTIDVASITSKVVRIKNILILKPEIAYESNSNGNNLETIQKNVDHSITTHLGGGERKNEKSTSTGSKKMIVDDLQIRDAQVTVATSIFLGQSLTLPVPSIHLTGIGQGSGGASPDVVIQQILNPLINNVASAVARAATQGVKNGLDSVSGKLKGLFR